MKLRLIAWLVGGVLLLSSRAGAAEAVGPEQQIKDLVRAWIDAETRQDEATLRRILNDRIVATFGDGAPIGKEDYVKRNNRWTVLAIQMVKLPPTKS